MKKLITLLLFLLTIALLTTPAYASQKQDRFQGEGRITLNGREIATSYNGLLPLRSIANHIGGTVTWDSSTRQATLIHNGNSIILTIGYRTANVNGRNRSLDVAPTMIDNRLMVSPCFIADFTRLGVGKIGDLTVLTTATATQIPALIYHHILPDSVNENRLNCAWTISRTGFAKQMEYLNQNGFYTPSLDELEAFMFQNRPLPANSVIIHFDDGYYSNYVYAAPILRANGLRAVMFAITHEAERLGEEQPPINHRRLTMASHRTLRENQDVFETASHTHNMHNMAEGSRNTILVTSSYDKILADTLQSFNFVANHRHFAYPHGQYNATVIDALQEAGITVAYTTTVGYITRQSDPMRLPRFTIVRDTTMQQFMNIINRRG